VALSVSAAKAEVPKLETRQDTLDWFEKARFGIFIHWDPRVQVGEVDKVSRGGTKHLQRKAISTKWREFNPEKFDAGEWVKLFTDAGAKYFTFTTKHQYGFSMFDNPYTDFDMMSTRFKRDICKELADAAKEKITVCWYHSSEGGVENEKRYKIKGMHPHTDLAPKKMTFEEWRYKSVEHLLTNYGKIAILWWDGKHTGTPELLDMVREKQPHILMNGRIKVPGHIGDFTTPEQKIGTFNMRKPWECCMPLEGNIWFYCGGFDIKSAEECTKILIQCASGDGNLLLSTSPMPDGRIQPEQAAAMLGVGRFLKKYGQTIYSTRGGPYKPGRWGGSTRNGSKIYLHITKLPEDGKLTLPALPQKITAHKLLTPGSVEVEQTDKCVNLILNKEALAADVIDRIVELTTDGDTMDITPIETMDDSESPAIDGKVTAPSTK
jgi:alpha-L-fucosidase